MTEQEWEVCADPARLLEHLIREKPSERKLRLLDCACWRRRAPRFLNSGGRQLLEAIGEVEAYVDGGIPNIRPKYSRRFTLAGRGVRTSVRETMQTLSTHPRLGVPVAVLIGLLRDIFGNPFRPPSLCLPSLTPTVVQLAHAAYDERELPIGHLDPARLAVLADALEESGCTDPDILPHLRGPGPHVRGCHVIDALLGKQ